MDGILDKYNNLIEENPHKAIYYLSLMYGEMFEQHNTQIGMFGKLVKLYGVNRVKLALMDMYDMENVKQGNPYPLLVWFIKKRIEGKTIVPDTNLSSFVDKQKETMGKNKLVEKRTLDE